MLTLLLERATSLRVLSALAMACALAACGPSSIVVDGEVPADALIVPMPINMGVYYPEEFRDYSVNEDIPLVGEWTITVGPAQTEAFRSVLPTMFDGLVELDDPLQDAPVDAVLVPRVDRMQFAVPNQTKIEFFEIWIRYDLTLQKPGSGEIIASWPLTAYGRTPSQTMTSSDSALNGAALMALRDASAFLAIEFENTRELRAWFREMDLEPAPQE